MRIIYFDCDTLRPDHLGMLWLPPEYILKYRLQIAEKGSPV